VAEKWRKDAKLKIPGASPFATRSGNVCGDSAKLPALANNGLWEFRFAAPEARYFHNFVDISEAVGVNSPAVLRQYGRPCNAIWLRTFNCPEDRVYRNRLERRTAPFLRGPAITDAIVNSRATHIFFSPGRHFAF